jgi:glycosyltransferase involved in cell wall biosynthesis
MMQTNLRQTLVIPAHNEEALLPRLLNTVDVARARYSFGAGAIEVIVADNASTDRTAEIATARGCRVVPVATRAIAAARNGGGAHATSPILAFVDADLQIHPDTFNGIERALADGRIVGGATGVTLERWSLGLAASYAMIVPIVLLTGMDTGVVFCRRSDFVEIGGYDERRRVAEDVAFLWALKRLGKSRRQRLTRLRSVKAIASTRKFDRHGDWHYFREMTRLAVVRLWNANATEELIRKYWYDDRG